MQHKYSRTSSIAIYAADEKAIQDADILHTLSSSLGKFSVLPSRYCLLIRLVKDFSAVLHTMHRSLTGLYAFWPGPIGLDEFGMGRFFGLASALSPLPVTTSKQVGCSLMSSNRCSLRNPCDSEQFRCLTGKSISPFSRAQILC